MLKCVYKTTTYTVLTDREDRSHGGIAIYTKDKLAVETLKSYSNGTREMLSLFIKELNIIIIVIYRPPNTTPNLFEDVLQKIINVLDHLPTPNTDFLLLRDFNFPNVNWDTREMTEETPDEKFQARQLTSLVEARFLTQFIDKPTKGSNILDLLISNNHGMIHSYDLYKTSMADHKICEAIISVNSLTNKPTQSQQTRAKMANLNFHHKDID